MRGRSSATTTRITASTSRMRPALRVKPEEADITHGYPVSCHRGRATRALRVAAGLSRRRAADGLARHGWPDGADAPDVGVARHAVEKAAHPDPRVGRAGLAAH